MENELKVTFEHWLYSCTSGHFFNYLRSLGHQVFIQSWGEEFINEERPRDKDEKQSITKLWLWVHAHGVTIEADPLAVSKVCCAHVPPLRGPDTVVVSITGFDVQLGVLQHLRRDQGCRRIPTWNLENISNIFFLQCHIYTVNLLIIIVKFALILICSIKLK